MNSSDWNFILGLAKWSILIAIFIKITGVFFPGYESLLLIILLTVVLVFKIYREIIVNKQKSNKALSKSKDRRKRKKKNKK